MGIGIKNNSGGARVKIDGKTPTEKLNLKKVLDKEFSLISFSKKISPEIYSDGNFYSVSFEAYNNNDIFINRVSIDGVFTQKKTNVFSSKGNLIMGIFAYHNKIYIAVVEKSYTGAIYEYNIERNSVTIISTFSFGGSYNYTGVDAYFSVGHIDGKIYFSINPKYYLYSFDLTTGRISEINVNSIDYRINAVYEDNGIVYAVAGGYIYIRNMYKNKYICTRRM